MKKINFNVPMQSIDGRDATQNGVKLLMKSIVANTLGSSKPKAGADAIRLLNIAMEIYKSEEAVALEDADIKTIVEILKGADLTVMGLGQILKTIEETPVVK